MRILRVLAAASVLLLSTAALAADNPEGFVQTLTAEAIDAAKSGGNDGSSRHAALGRLVADGFDLTEISDLVLGRYWQSASAAERAAFRSALRDYLVLTYAGRMGSAADATVRVVGSEPAGAYWKVQSAVAGGERAAYAVDWLVRRDDSRWLVVDVMIDGISMAATYRDQFAAVIRANGGNIGALTRKLEQKNRALAN